MASATVLVLGGYGQTGRRIVHHLAARSDATVIVAGRDERAAGEVARQAATGGSRVLARRLDAADGPAVTAALRDVDLLVNASSAVAHAAGLVTACLATGTDWCDTQVARRQSDLLHARSAEIEAAGRRFVTQAGFHPGVPAALVRWAAARLQPITAAWTAGILRPRGGFPPSSATGELLDEFRDYRAHVFTDGAWRRARWTSVRDMPTVEFALGLGRARTFPYDLDELRPLPDAIPSLTRLGFGIAGFDPVTDTLVTPALLAGTRLGRWTYPALARLLESSTRRFGRPPFGVAVQCDAQGLRDGTTVRLRVALGHPDAYELTAVPVVSLVEQVLDGTITDPGLQLMGLVVDPSRLLHDCAAMGLHVVIDDPLRTLDPPAEPASSLPPGTPVRVGEDIGVVISGAVAIPENHVPVWFGETDAGTPRIRTVPADYCAPISGMAAYH